MSTERQKGSNYIRRDVSYRNSLAQNVIKFNQEKLDKTYAFPAEMFKAEIHQIANSYGYIEAGGKYSDICPCCDMPVNNQQLPMNFSTTPDFFQEQLESEFKISSGTSIFFTFIKMSIFYLILRFIITDSYNLFSSITFGTYCNNKQCGQFFTSQISSYNKIDQPNLLKTLDVLNLITILFSMAFFTFYKKIFYKIELIINISQHSQEDYTLYLQNIPILLTNDKDEGLGPRKTTFQYQSELQKYLQQKIDVWIRDIKKKPDQELENIEKDMLNILSNSNYSKYKVTSITTCFDLHELQVLKEMRQKIIESYIQKRESLNQGNQLIESDTQQKDLKKLLSQIKLINHQQLILSRKFTQDRSINFQLTHFVGKAFVSFQYQHYRDYILRSFEKDYNFLAIAPDNAMEVSIASNPKEIIWNNMKVDKQKRQSRILTSFFLLFLLIFITFAEVLFLNSFQYILKKKIVQKGAFQLLSLPVINNLLLIIINDNIYLVIQKLTEYEKHETKSTRQFWHILKLITAQIYNTVFIYLLISMISGDSYASQQGLIVQVSSLFIASAILEILFNIFNPVKLTNQLINYIQYNNKKQVDMFQIDLNNDIQKQQFYFVQRYSYYILQIYTSSFYSYLVPVTTPILILTFILQYWIQKYNLFKKSTCKDQLDFNFSRKVFKIFQFSLFFFAMGNMIFSYVLQSNYINPVNIVSFIITLGYFGFILFAPRHLQKRIFQIRQQFQTKTYSQCLDKKLFRCRYWTTNPATKFIKQFDINTKKQINSMQVAKFADRQQLYTAKIEVILIYKKFLKADPLKCKLINLTIENLNNKRPQRNDQINMHIIQLLNLTNIKMSQSKRGDFELSRNVSFRKKLASNLIDFNKQRMNLTYAFPSAFKQAEIHQIANTYGFNSMIEKDGSPSSVCPCCKLPINTQILPLDQETTPDVRLDKIVGTQYKLSSGISLFFTFIKMAICYLILRFILTDSFNLISSAAAGTYCKNNSCNSFFTSQISSYNKIQQQNLIFALDILNLITIIFSMAFFNFYRKIQYKIQNMINDYQHTQDDYTLFLQNIPILLIDQKADPDNITFDYGEKLKKYFQGIIDDWISSIKYKEPESLENIERQIIKILKAKKDSQLKKVTSITMCFDLSEMQVLNEMRKKLMDRYVEIANKRTQNQQNNQLVQEDKQAGNFENILHQIKLINHEELHLSQKFAEDSSMAFNLTHFVGRAFISFQYQHYRDYILRQFERNKNFLKIRPDYPIKVSIASTPNEILWNNMKVDSATRKKSIFISYLILMMVLAFAFGGTLLMTRLKFTLSKKNNEQADFFTFLLTILMTVVTLVINFILSMIVKQLTEYEKHQTKSNFVFSHIIKVVITQFINTSIIYYVSSNIAQSPYLSEQGLVIQVSSLFLTSAVIQVLLNLANIPVLIKQAKKYLNYRNKTEINMFQLDLNKQIEKVDFDVVDRYSYYILQLYACSFYSYLAPIATPCLIITFFAQYWIDKLNLFKRSNCKHQMDFALSRTMLKIFQTSLFVFAAGNFIFSIVLHHNYVNPVNIAALVITGIYSCFILFAPRYLQKKLFGSYEQIQTKAYSQCVKLKLFKDQYWTSNPATKFVKEIDINTKQQVTQQQVVKFANLDQLRQAKENLDLLLKQDPKFDEDFQLPQNMQQAVRQEINKSYKKSAQKNSSQEAN